MKTALRAFALSAGLIASCHSFHAQNTYPFPASGPVGIGITNPLAPLHILGHGILGSSIGSNQLISITSGFSSTGGGNAFQDGIWLYRKNSGSDWYSAVLHDGVSIDGQYLTPGVNTLTWWERNPGSNIQSWGNNASTYMTLNGGNLGLNTTTPFATLEAHSATVNSPTICASANAISGTPGSPASRNLLFVPLLGAGGYNPLVQTNDFGVFWNDVANSGTGLVIGPWGSAAAGLRINSNGNVGIGVPIPATALHVNGTITLNAGANSSWTPDGWNNAMVVPNFSAIRTATPGSLTKKYLGFAMGDNNTTGVNSGSPLVGWFWMASGNTGTSGNCVAYPMSLTLDVNGNATLTLSQNQLGWCDFVFAKDYKRMSILDKEEYYVQNKRLPGIDPAAVVEQKGIDIGQNMKGMLQNLEEDRLDITALYKVIMEQQKVIIKQGTQLQDVERELTSLKNGK
jgi:hypothetical protein